ncbi:hypothetical protein [Cystobacter fuscus]|uniref:hypothetical protein n=1 Tax=Cystobacter fuscus TaxID=43 RepID=UPI002B2D13AE|nr:hypothetical protein F0U63_12065 [Cystobacter fuscus]
MSSVRNVRSAPVYTPPKSKDTEPNTLVAGQRVPTSEASAKKPEPKQKVGHESSSSFQPPTPSRPDADRVPRIHVREPKTKEEALLRSDEVLNPKSEDVPGEGWTILRDGEELLDVHESRAASKQVKDNLKLELQEIKKLSKSDREKYMEVRSTLGGGAASSMGLLALQKMLFQGRLPGAKDFKGEGTTLDHLARAASGKELAEGINRREFTHCLVRELATPSSINQGARRTCVPTALMIDLADKNPAEYARISNGLASKEGKVELADGKTTLERAQETSFTYDKSGRSLNQRIIAPALMEVANEDLDYDDRTGDGGGAYDTGTDKLNDAIHGKDMGYIEVGDTEKDRWVAMRMIDIQLKQGKNALVGMNYGGEGHEVLVTRTSREDGKDYVYFTNPWGRQERMPREAFAELIYSTHEGSRSDKSTHRRGSGQQPEAIESTVQTLPSLASLF